jgi:hypothetical protein
MNGQLQPYLLSRLNSYASCERMIYSSIVSETEYSPEDWNLRNDIDPNGIYDEYTRQLYSTNTYPLC